MSFEKKSPWLIHYDGSSCNGCDIEVLACLTPLYDVERFGIVNTGDPKHADIFLVTGGVNAQNLPVVRQIYEQMPEPKVVIAVGTCACSGGIARSGGCGHGVQGAQVGVGELAPGVGGGEHARHHLRERGLSLAHPSLAPSGPAVA